MKMHIKTWFDFDKRVLFILIYVPIALTLIEFLFVPVRSVNLFDWLNILSIQQGDTLCIHLWWISGCLLLNVVIPTIVLKYYFKASLSSFGLKIQGTLKDSKIYLGLFILMLPVIYLASLRSSFQWTYPLYKPPYSDFFSTSFLIFEIGYFLQFFAVEYFFRGIMVLGLKPILGRYSTLVMLAPYVMIHFHKPLAETLAALVAGLVLGTLSWQTGTMIYGWFLHYAVALSMDLLAIFKNTNF